MRENFELAAALFSLVGERIPHDSQWDPEAERLEREESDEEKLFPEVLRLCGEPLVPKQLYLCARVYGRMGKKYVPDVIRCAEAYFKTDGWKELAGGIWKENGIPVDSGNFYKAALFSDLASAYETESHTEKAYSSARKAYLLEPYRAEYVGKAADLLSRLCGGREALDFLTEQKNSPYYRPAYYVDAFGNRQKNDRFRRQLDAEIGKRRILLGREK